jgi:hypothetical protein
VEREGERAGEARHVGLGGRAHLGDVEDGHALKRRGAARGYSLARPAAGPRSSPCARQAFSSFSAAVTATKLQDQQRRQHVVVFAPAPAGPPRRRAPETVSS